MDKSAIKRFAVYARRELISRVIQKAAEYGIYEEEILNRGGDVIENRVISEWERVRRNAVITEIDKKGYREVMEEIAYTWFNRFMALHFMEVNGYLPLCVFTDGAGVFRPQILSECLDLDGTVFDSNKIIDYKEHRDDEGLYKYLLITECNHLHGILPGLFQPIGDATELLFPDGLLRDGSILSHMVADIAEDDWKNQVQIIGWLYQYYNKEPKDRVFADLKKNIKVTKEKIPAATQLFTPDWIVRYMAENSLGRKILRRILKNEIAMGKIPENKEARETEIARELGWDYYLPEAAQTEKQEKTQEEAGDDLCAIDPCCGSGHVLVYLFDMLMQLYKREGYMHADAVRKILTENLYGLDLDPRAAQLAYFAVMMKARSYDSRFFSCGITPHIYAIAESNGVEAEAVAAFCGKEKTKKDKEKKETVNAILAAMKDASEYGSLITAPAADYDALFARLAEIENGNEAGLFRESILEDLGPVIRVAHLLSKRYDAVVTNPPYMGSGNMNGVLADYLKKHYTDYKSDFFSAFIVRAANMTKRDGYCGFLTPYVWMFIQSYEKLRNYLYTNANIETLIQFEYSAFEEATVPICTFVFRMGHIAGKKGKYFRLVDYRGGMEVQRQKTLEAIGNPACGYYYEQSTDNFAKIPGSPVAYWVSEAFLKIYDNPTKFEEEADIKAGVMSGDDNRFVRYWFEVEKNKFDTSCTSVDDCKNHKTKWFPITRGGQYRKWYGNLESVINLYDGGYEIEYENSKNHRLRDSTYYFREGIAWTMITSYKLSVRYVSKGILFGNGGPTCFFKKDTDVYLAILNSKVADYIINVVNPSLNTVISDICGIPINQKVFNDEVRKLSAENISLSQADWNSYETSWNFWFHPLVVNRERGSLEIDPDAKRLLSVCYEAWKGMCEERFLKLQQNEETLNRIFIDLYGLSEELSPTVADRDVTVHRIFDTREDVTESMAGSPYVRTKRDEIVSLLSYAVGCMLGRYAPDELGLLCAGPESFDKIPEASYVTPHPILWMTEDSTETGDLWERLVSFLKTVYGKDTLSENLAFIAEALGGGGAPRDVIMQYFRTEFFADHCKMYKKRPIYWLLDSGRKHAFTALLYMHRYTPETMAQLRTEYVLPRQMVLRREIEEEERRIPTVRGALRAQRMRRLSLLKEEEAELRTFEEKVHHLADLRPVLDLDDGVKVNYEKLSSVLAKI
jgi:type II restriction/modification system DNA methylase subunit YeeA